MIDGRLLDNGREHLPLLTLLAFVGAGVAVVRFRRDAVARVILVFTVVSFVLYFGRPTLGPVVDWIPWLDELPLHRFIGPFQLGALLLAGIGGSGRDRLRAGSRAPGRVGPDRATWSPRSAVLERCDRAACRGVERVRFEDVERDAHRRAAHQASATTASRSRSSSQLATRRGGGRIFAGNVTSGGNFVVGLIPAYAEILNDDGMGIGFVGRVASVSVDHRDGVQR